MRSNYEALAEGIFCADSLQFLRVVQVCGDAPTAREFLAVCAQEQAVVTATPKPPISAAVASDWH